MTGGYYEKAQNHVKINEVEEAITAFIAGLDRGDAKCAYGLVHTVINRGSYTVTEEEAISMFSSSYPGLRLLAREGDPEAMVMVAEGIRYGFVDEEDEPYLFWLIKAAELGHEGAMAILEELDLSDDPWALPGAAVAVTADALEGMDATDRLLLDDLPEPGGVEDMPDVTAIPEEHVLLDEPDWCLREQCGIEDHLRDRKRQYELCRCRDDQTVD